MSRLKRLQDIEGEIDTLMKDRAVCFSLMDNEPGNTQTHRSLQAKVSMNTKRIKKLRTRWKEVYENNKRY